MKDTYFIVFTRDGVNRLLKRAPDKLGPGEYAQQVDIEVDDALFRPVVIPVVKLQVGQTGVARWVGTEVVDGSDQSDQSDVRP